MIRTNPFEVSDFSGGITDNYLDGVAKRYREADNFIITYNKKLYTRPGSNLYDEANPQIPTGAQRITRLVNFDEDLLINSGTRYFYNDGTINNLQGPGGYNVFDQGDTSTPSSYGEWNDHLFVSNDAFSKPAKIFMDNANQYQVRTAGLPGLSSTPNVSGGAGANSYIYAFVQTVEYNVKTLTFKDESALTLVEIANIAEPSSVTVNITGIPTLVNGVGDNYDTTNLKIEIYRTIAGGTVFYKIGEVTNGTAIFNDTFSDASIQLNQTLYNADGTLDKEAPPLCKYNTVVRGVGYYAHIKVGTNVFKNRVRQSLQDDPDSCPSALYVDVDDEVTGVSSYDFTPIVGCKNSLYRLDGFYNRDGSGTLTQQRISDSVGVVSNSSFVKTNYGLFFAGTDGFYVTNGYDVRKLSNEFNIRYRDIVANNPERIVGCFDDVEKKVYWTAQKDGASGDNDMLFCLDLNFGLNPDSCFTTWSGGDSFAPTSIAFLGKKLIRADKRGYIFQHDTNVYTDLKVDTLTAPANWVRQTIIYNYESCAYNMGTNYMRKWIPRIVSVADNPTNLALQINSINDDGKKVSSLSVISFNNVIIWGDDDVVWGEQDLIWNYDGLIEEQRRFPANGLRCSYKQVQFTNAYVEIATSVASGQVAVDSSLKTATLINVGAAYPADSVDYYMSFSNDNYQKEYLVTQRSDTTLVLSDSGNTLITGNYDWKLKGYPKKQILNLLAYCIDYAILGKTQQVYTGDS